MKNIQQASTLVKITPKQKNLMSLFWPGPVTFVLPDPQGSWAEVTANSKYLGMRCSPYQFLKDLLEEFGRPITTTSANISGQKVGESKDDFAWLPEEVLKCDAEKLSMLGQASLVVKIDNSRFKVLRENKALLSNFKEVAKSMGFSESP